MKILIAADMEGVSGVVHWDHVTPGHAEYARFRKLMTDDVNAAISGAFEAVPTVEWQPSVCHRRSLNSRSTRRLCGLSAACGPAKRLNPSTSNRRSPLPLNLCIRKWPTRQRFSPVPSEQAASVSTSPLTICRLRIVPFVWQ